MTHKTAPVVIEITEAQTLTPATAPAVPEIDAGVPQGQAVQTLALLTARRPSFLRRLFWGVLLALLGAVISIAAWDFTAGLLERNLWLGRIVLGGIGLFMFAALGLALREWRSLVRLRRVDGLRAQVEAAMTDDLNAARVANAKLKRFYRGRVDLRWALDNLENVESDILDGDALLSASERELMTPLDAAARREVEASARQVASITAIVPLALADVAVALTANLRMVRRIAEIYGGRAGTFGSWRLLKTVMLHLVATGAVAVGDDLIGSVLGGGLVGKISRRFGEGVVNGALTARVGVAAMEVCRPMPFQALERPKVTVLVKNALAGLFSRG